MLDSLNMLKQGGWTMVPLAFCSVAALTIIIERAAVLRHARIVRPGLLKSVRGYTGEGASADAAARLFRRTPGPLARILEEVLESRTMQYQQAMEKMYAAGRAQIGRLERGLTVLEIVAGVSPLLGLLGTVLGMVTVFNAITAEGLGDPQVLSDGIAKALITTVAGLCVAIPSLAFHSLYSKRAADLAMEMQNIATEFLLMIHGNKRDAA